MKDSVCVRVRVHVRARARAVQCKPLYLCDERLCMIELGGMHREKLSEQITSGY